jgi:hypothetical protein
MILLYVVRGRRPAEGYSSASTWRYRSPGIDRMLGFLDQSKAQF